jgi:uncharacterized protein (TIGR02186 family)
MRKAACLFAAMVPALLATAPPYAQAERLITSLSSHQVMIGSSFTGTELVLFGSVERDAATVARRGEYDIVVTVVGPREMLVTREKSRVLGVWANTSTETFDAAPSYLLRRFEVGLANIAFTKDAKPDDVAPQQQALFREALVRIMSQRGLYREGTNAVTFLTPNLFRASIVLPAVAPVGNYEIETKLFADGVMIARTTSALEIRKIGIEQFIASAAREHSFLYGLGVMGMALATGWIASIVFRRD